LETGKNNVLLQHEDDEVPFSPHIIYQG